MSGSSALHPGWCAAFPQEPHPPSCPICVEHPSARGGDGVSQLAEMYLHPGTIIPVPASCQQGGLAPGRDARWQGSMGEPHLGLRQTQKPEAQRPSQASGCTDSHRRYPGRCRISCFPSTPACPGWSKAPVLAGSEVPGLTRGRKPFLPGRATSRQLPREQLPARAGRRGAAAGPGRCRVAAGAALACPAVPLTRHFYPQQPGRRARRGEESPRGASLLGVGGGTGTGAFTPSRGFAGGCREICMLHEPVRLPRGGTAPWEGRVAPTGGDFEVPRHLVARCESCLGFWQRHEEPGAASHDKRVIDTLVCSAPDPKQCPLFISREAWLYRVSSS